MYTNTYGNSYPSPRWISIWQACQWLAAKAVPYSRDVEKRVARNTPPIDEVTFQTALRDIQRLAYNEKLTLRGQRVQNISYKDVVYSSQFENCDVSINTGDGVRDVPAHLTDIMPSCLERASITECFSIIFPDNSIPGEYCVYVHVMLDFKQLVQYSPPPKGLTVQIDGDEGGGADNESKRIRRPTQRDVDAFKEWGNALIANGELITQPKADSWADTRGIGREYARKWIAAHFPSQVRGPGRPKKTR